jgi:hypothetical protein
MPTVKTYQRQITTKAAPTVERREYRIGQVETPQNQPAPTADVYGAQFGNAVAQAGQQLYAAEQHKQDQIRLLDADRQAGDLENQLIYDPKTGALNVRGKESFGLVDTVGKQWDDATGKIRAGLSNDRQRLAFDQYNVAKRRSIMDRVNQHIAKETYRVDGEALEGKVENETNAAIADGRPERINQALASVTQAYADYGQRYGMSPEQTKAATDKAVSRIHVGAIDRMLKDGNDIQAKVYFEHVSPQILGEHLGQIEGALKEGTLRGESQRIADSIINTPTPSPRPTGKSAYAKPGSYVTQLSSEDEAQFQQWVKNNQDIVGVREWNDTPTSDYDLRGYWKSQKGKRPTSVNPNDNQIHFPDTFKTPYHESFSNESQYATADAPKWNDKDQLIDKNGKVVYDERAKNAGPPTEEELLQEVAKRTAGNPELRDKTEARVKAFHAARIADEREQRAKRNQTIKEQLEAEKQRKEQEKAQREQLVGVTVPNLIDQGQPKDVKTFLDKIDPKLWSEATSKEREEWVRYATKEEKGEKVKTDMGAWLTLSQMASEHPDEFLKEDLNSPFLRNRLSDADLKHFSEVRAKIQKGEQPKQLKDFRINQQVINETLQNDLGLDPRAKENRGTVARLHQLVRERAELLQHNTGKAPLNEDIQAITDDILSKHFTVKGWIWDTDKPLIQATVGDIPKEDRAQIEAALRSKNHPVTEDAILDLFIRTQERQKKK